MNITTQSHHQNWSGKDVSSGFFSTLAKKTQGEKTQVFAHFQKTQVEKARFSACLYRP